MRFKNLIFILTVGILNLLFMPIQWFAYWPMDLTALCLRICTFLISFGCFLTVVIGAFSLTKKGSKIRGILLIIASLLGLAGSIYFLAHQIYTLSTVLHG